jgi:nucleotide-binding universal stress UspA family protein
MTMNEAQGAVAVGYDGHPHSDVALEWAARHAAQVDRPLLVVHASGVPDGYVGSADGAALTVSRVDLRAQGQAVLHKGLAKVEGVDPSLVVRGHLAVAEAKDVLEEASASGADLVVVGTRGHGRVVAYLLGSVSEDLSHTAACPVVVVRRHEVPDQHSPWFGRVVVGLDGTDASTAALEEAFAFAELEGRPLAVLHARDDAGRWRDRSVGEPSTPDDLDGHLAEKLVACTADHPDVPVSLHPVEADPRWALVDASRHAHLVVVGSRGRGDTEAFVRGSVSRYVLEHAHGPVLVARASSTKVHATDDARS